MTLTVSGLEVPKTPSPVPQAISKEDTQTSVQSEQESEAQSPRLEEQEGTFTSIADTETTDGEE